MRIFSLDLFFLGFFPLGLFLLSSPVLGAVQGVVPAQCVTPVGATGGEEAVGVLLREVEALRREGNSQVARRSLKEGLDALDSEELGIAAEVDLGAAVLASLGPHRAASFFSSALAQGETLGRRKTSPLQLSLLAAAHAGLGERQEVGETLRQCRRRFPGSVGCDTRRAARLLEALGDPSGAARLLDEELKAAGPKVDRVVERLRLAVVADTPEENLRLARRARARFSEDDRVSDALVTALVRAERWGEAVTTMEELYNRGSPHDGLYLSRIAALLDRMRAVATQDAPGRARWEALERSFVTRLGRSPDDQVALWVVSLRQLQRGELEQAMSRLRRLESLAAPSPAVLVALARGHLWRGELKKARQLVDRAVKLRPDYAPAWRCHARVHMETSSKVAVASLRRYLDLTVRAGVQNWPARIADARADLAALERGEIPRRRDDPRQKGATLTSESLSDPKPLPPPWLFFGGLAALISGFLVGFWWRRRGR